MVDLEILPHNFKMVKWREIVDTDHQASRFGYTKNPTNMSEYQYYEFVALDGQSLMMD